MEAIDRRSGAPDHVSWRRGFLMPIRGVRSALERSLAGIDRTGFVVVVIAALINTIRRSINTLFYPPFLGWLWSAGETFIVAVPPAIATSGAMTPCKTVASRTGRCILRQPRGRRLN
jgi:hypothetical protein